MLDLNLTGVVLNTRFRHSLVILFEVVKIVETVNVILVIVLLNIFLRLNNLYLLQVLGFSLLIIGFV
jgi:hypothetical protein